MTLDFLTPQGPPAQSVISALLAKGGATIVERDGWLIATTVAAPEEEAQALADAVGWADVSHRDKCAGEGGLIRIDRADGDLDLTAQYGAISVAGPRARELIARICALDLRPQVAPPGANLAGSIARTPGAIIVEGADRFVLLFGVAYSQYLWEVVTDAGEHLGGRAVGTNVLDSAPVNA